MTITALLTLAEFTVRTLAPESDVDNVEADAPGYLLGRLKTNTARIYARLRKRYPTAFVAPYAEACLDWLVCLTTFDLYMKRGVDPADQSIAHIKAEYDRANAELLEAANGETGLFDLPIDDTKDATAIAKGGPQVYTETSPYGWTTIQREDGRDEDRSR